MKFFFKKNLQHLIAAGLLLVFAGGYLFIEFSVFRTLGYQAPPAVIDSNLKARNLSHRVLRGDGAFQTWLCRFRPDKPSDSIVLLNIDYDLISNADSWPLPRKTIADIFFRLAEMKPQLVLVDAIFEWPQTPWVIEEVSRRITPENAEALMPVIGALNHDGLLKSAMTETDYLLIYFLAFQKDHVSPREQQKYIASMGQHAYAAPPVEVIGDGLRDVFPYARILGVRDSILPLQLNASGQGYAWFNPDRHGTISQVALFHRLETTEEVPKSFFLPNIIAEAVRVLTGEGGYRLHLDDGEATAFGVGPYSVRTDPIGEMTLNFYNREHVSKIPVVRAFDLLNGTVDPTALKGKVVLLGSDTNLLNDYLQTPVGKLWGTEMIGYGISNVLNGDYFYRPRWAPLFELIQMLLISVLVALLCHFLKPLYSLVAVLLVAVSVTTLTGGLFVAYGQMFSLTLPLALLVLTFLQYSLVRFVTEEKQKRFLKNALSLYLSPELSRQVAENPALLKLEGKEEELTVLFSDIRNFSSISETMTAEVLTAYLQRYFSPMTEIIFSTDGTLDKYIGDAIMAFWGAPLEQEDHALRACRAAVGMLERLDQLTSELKSEGLPPIDIGIGLHTGPMRVGNMGSEKRLNYTVLGDNVNLGSRLEGLTKFYGVRLIVSRQTWDKVQHAFHGRELDRVKVKGKEEAVTIFEIIGSGEPSVELKEDIALWAEGLGAFRDREWSRAETAFRRWQSSRKDVPAAIYLNMIKDYREKADEGEWPPVSVMTEK